MPLLSVEHASKRFGAVVALDDVSLDSGPRRIFRAAGPVRLRQDHVDAARRRLRDAGFRARDARRARPRRRAAASASRQYDVPVLRLVSASERFRQYRLRPATPAREPRRDPVARRGIARHRANAKPRRAANRAAFRRPKAARRARPRAGAGAVAAAARRAARRARPQAARGDAVPAQGHSAAR